MTDDWRCEWNLCLVRLNERPVEGHYMMGLVPDKFLAGFRLIFRIHCWQWEGWHTAVPKLTNSSGTHLEPVFLLLMLDTSSSTLLPSVVDCSFECTYCSVHCLSTMTQFLYIILRIILGSLWYFCYWQILPRSTCGVTKLLHISWTFTFTSWPLLDCNLCDATLPTMHRSHMLPM